MILVTTLCHKFVSYFDSGFQQVFVQIIAVDSQQFGDASTFLRVMAAANEGQLNDDYYAIIKNYKIEFCTYLGTVGFGLFFTATLLELHATHVHNGSGNLIDVVLFFFGKTEHVERLLHVFSRKTKIYAN